MEERVEKEPTKEEALERVGMYRTENYQLKLDKINALKKVEEEKEKYKQLEHEFKASERFREEARRRCIRFEKLMYMMVDNINVDNYKD